ncbi:radical SAM family heme chaperone HemW [Leptolyngbya sp. 15MV]|nr:radical SAM family heme chaperone HemW [Leptolyngbya sp. 15MV]
MARALYIHWPFCARKCPYCDFNSHVRDRVDVDAFRRAFMAELAHEHALADGGPLRSIFFGGGTPSLMPPALVGELLVEAERRWGFDPAIEITLEANPSSVEAANFAALADAGINRVSLGLQSLDDGALQFLGRLHGADEGLAALEVAQRHFARVSFDLIYALPGQTAEAWEEQVARALGFGTGHLSLYQLTIEPGTRFATDVRRGTFAPLEDDPAAELYTLTQELTRAAGAPAYEISNHARPGEESRHNLAYWRYEDYLGIGPGAHGRRGGKATLRHKKPENWLAACEAQGHGMVEETVLTSHDQAAEALLMGLRLTEGIDPAAIARRFELDTADLIDADRLALHRINGLLWQRGERLGVTAAGMPLLDALLGEIVAGELVRA